MSGVTDETDSSNTSFKWPSVSWTLDFDLVSFILENSCSQQYVEPNAATVLIALSTSPGKRLVGRICFLQKSAWLTAAKRDFSSSEHCRSTSSICTSHGADSTSTSKGEVKSLKSSLYSILLNNLSLLRCRCLRCHGYLGGDKRRATEASDWPLLISAAYQHPRMSYRPRELIDCYYVSFNTST